MLGGTGVGYEGLLEQYPTPRWGHCSEELAGRQSWADSAWHRRLHRVCAFPASGVNPCLPPRPAPTPMSSGPSTGVTNAMKT